MKAILHPGLSSFEENHVPRGHFEIATEPNGQKRFWFACPGRCGALSAIAIRPVVDPKLGQHSWEWDGNSEEPTLNPSINHVDCWHGWLKKGVFAE